MRTLLGWLAAFIVPLLVVGALCHYTGRDQAASERLAEEALSRVHPGMPLAEAEQVLSDTWYHAACPYSPDVRGSTHLFLYGSGDLGSSTIVLLRANGPPDRQVVTFRGRLRIDDLAGYGRCFPRDFRAR